MTTRLPPLLKQFDASSSSSHQPTPTSPPDTNHTHTLAPRKQITIKHGVPTDIPLRIALVPSCHWHIAFSPGPCPPPNIASQPQTGTHTHSRARPTHRINSIDVGFRTDQKLCTLRMPLIRCPHERRIAILHIATSSESADQRLRKAEGRHQHPPSYHPRGFQRAPHSLCACRLEMPKIIIIDNID
jgi:hypothetical protein